MTTTIAPSTAPTEPVATAASHRPRRSARSSGPASASSSPSASWSRSPSWPSSPTTCRSSRTPTQKILGANGEVDGYNWGPGSTAWFGTDGVSNDVFSQVHLRRPVTSLQVGVVRHRASASSSAASLGVIAGYFRGWIDRVVMIITDCLPGPAAVAARDHPREPPRRLQGGHTSWLGWLSRKWQIVFTLGILAIGAARPHRASPDALAP